MMSVSSEMSKVIKIDEVSINSGIKFEISSSRCRCCYGEASTCVPLRGQCVSEDKVENYSDILADIFNITIAKLRSELICLDCVRRLHDAQSFKHLVLESEKKHLMYLAKGALLETIPIRSKSSEVTVKLEQADADESQWPTDYLDTEDLLNGEESGTEYKDEDENKPLIQLIKEKKQRKKKVQADIKSENVPNRQNVPNREASKRKISSRAPSTDVVAMPTPMSVKVEGDMARKNVESILRAFCGTTQVKAEYGAFEIAASKKDLTQEEISELWDARSERQAIKKNVMKLIRHTTMSPFVHHRSIFKCVFCGDRFVTFSLLRTHIGEAHKKIQDVIKKIAASKDITLVDINDLRCRFLKCMRPLEDVQAAKEHLVSEHNIKINMKHKDDVIPFKLGLSDDSFPCHLCDQTFHVFRNLSQHMNDHFPNYMCEVCGKAFVSSKRVRNHELSHENNGVYPCTRCGKVFPTVNLRNHHSLEHRPSRFRCPHCPEYFSKYIHRTNHLSEAHGITQRFVCRVCSKEFIHKPAFSAHTRSHAQKEKKVECSQCGMRFINNYALAKHFVSHTGERNFQCRVCGKRYGRKNTLREHMRIHENDRRFVCTECGQTFIQKCSLKGHIRSRHPHLISYHEMHSQ